MQYFLVRISAIHAEIRTKKYCMNQSQWTQQINGPVPFLPVVWTHFSNCFVLAFTSTNKAVRKMGPHNWKKWHRTVYLLLPLTLVHAIFLGADFGVNRGPDVKSEPDAGALIGMSILAACWFTLFLLRRSEVRIAPKLFQIRSKR